MEPILLFIVEQAFQIMERGCVLAPGPSAAPGAQIVRVGDSIRLVKPNGDSVDTQIQGIELLCRRPPSPIPTAPILLPRGISSEQVPEGTKVFLLPPME